MKLETKSDVNSKLQCNRIAISFKLNKSNETVSDRLHGTHYVASLLIEFYEKAMKISQPIHDSRVDGLRTKFSAY